MGKIRLLEEAVVNRIAAGEVVERPASVVKELVENSLDAGAQRLEIHVAGGGMRLVRVVDDGEGMDRDDAVLALERHATSKLAALEDLNGIRTLGFRGEALPSIAAVSELTLSTAVADGEGTEIEVRAGKIVRVEPCARRRGTTVEVRSLFYSVPARRKFLRSPATELSHVVRWVSRYALVRPQLAVRLTSEGQLLLDAPAVEAPFDRIRQVLGEARASALRPVAHEAGHARLRGFVAAPAHATARAVQHAFVNGRAIHDRLVWRAVRDALENAVPPGQSVPFVLFLELEGGAVDVNVHPQKTEVRFAKPQAIYELVRDGVARALRGASAPRYTSLRPRTGEMLAPGREPRGLGERPGPARDESQPTAAEPAALWAEPALSRWRALGQLRESYIVAEDAQGLVLVDQHAAHERVLFERYLAAAQEGQVEVQSLLFPRTMDFEPEAWIGIESGRAELERLGFRLEPFGGRAVRLDAVPALAAHVNPEVLLRELAVEAHRARSAAADAPMLRRRLVTTAACRAAVTVHTPMRLEQMQRLLDDLAATAQPQTCPHGRPAIFRLSLEEIERAFRRPTGRL